MLWILLSLMPGSAVGLVVWTCILAGVIQVIMLFLNRWKEDKLLKDIPSPPSHWLLGNAPELGETVHKNMDKWTKTHGPVYRIRSAIFKSAVVLSDPDSVKTIMSTTEPKEPEVYRAIEPWIGDGIIVTQGKKWLRTRRLLTPGFHFQILKPYVGIFSDSCHVMMNKWREDLKRSPRLETFSNLSQMMLNSLLKCVFGSVEMIDKGTLKAFIQANFDVTGLIIQRLSSPLMHNNTIYGMTENGKKFHAACKTIHEFSRTVIQAKKKAKQDEQKSFEDKKRHLDFLDILLEARDDKGVGLTDMEIQHEVDTFMFAGHDTTTSGLSWFLYNMAKHPEHQKKCVQEVEEVLGERDHVTWEDLSKFEYLTLCVKETLRLHAIVAWLSRRITKPMKLPNGMTIPKDFWVVSSVHSLHHNPDVWPDPYKFDPLRFTAENSRDRHPHAYIPFASGPRNCLGQNFALNELKTCGALLLRNFEFDIKDEPELIYQIVLRTKGGLWLNVRERK